MTDALKHMIDIDDKMCNMTDTDDKMCKCWDNLVTTVREKEDIDVFVDYHDINLCRKRSRIV